ncbi:hypothetical protein P7C70_g6578, partial [Phenoliferia sp. Uapishka_3]
MCTSNAVLFYGIVVRLWTLIRAARAHGDLVGPTMALKLIEYRRRLGTLGTLSGPYTISKLPTEIWSLIRDELYATALEDAFAEWLAEMRCDDCERDGQKRLKKRKSYSRSAEESHALPVYAWTEWEFPECDDCWEFFNEATGDDSYVDIPGWEELLLEHGMAVAVPTHQLSSGGDDYSLRANPICLPIIKRGASLPDQAQTLEANHNHHHGIPWYQGKHATISTGTFSAIVNDRPFHELVNRYQLELISKPHLAIEGVPTPVTWRHDPSGTESNEPEAFVALDGKAPQWRIWTCVDSCS